MKNQPIILQAVTVKYAEGIEQQLELELQVF